MSLQIQLYAEAVHIQERKIRTTWSNLINDQVYHSNTFNLQVYTNAEDQKRKSEIKALSEHFERVTAHLSVQITMLPKKEAISVGTQ